MQRVTALVGRARERKIFDLVMASTEAELVAVYGRRRVGKTFLIRELFGHDLSFELTGVHGAPLPEQLANAATALRAAGEAAGPPPTDWPNAFARIAAMLEAKARAGRRRVVFVDELPWLAARRSGFLRAFEHFWNSWAVKQRDLIVIVCGSAASWMVDELLNARGGLHNRVTRRMRLEPFSLAEVEEYLAARGHHWSRYQILELYTALGGIPYYLKQVERGDSPAVAIDRLCFAQDGPLRDEFDKLYASLFERPDRHVRIVRALGGRPQGLTRGQLAEVAGLSSGGGMTRLLSELEQSGFILRSPQLGQPTKEAIYRLIDEYSLFYLKWIEHHLGRGEQVWLNRRGSPAWLAWSGYAFEGVCLKHVALIKRALGIGSVETTESAWRHRSSDRAERGAQIDLVIDRKDMTINLCEMKFADGEVVIDKRYTAELRHKRDVFRRVTATRKTLLTTMITTHGVADNAYAHDVVDSALTMDALFAR